MINWKLCVVFIAVVILAAFIVFGLNSSKNNERIDFYENEMKILELEIKEDNRRLDSISVLLANKDRVIDSLYSNVSITETLYVERKSVRDEKIHNIPNMSSDDKYIFFSEQ